MKEVWKKLEEDIFQGRYYISNLGRVKRIAFIYYMYGLHKRIAPEKIIEPTFNNCGYLYFRVSYNRKMYNRSIHRLVAKTFIPNPNNLPQIDHIDGNKENNKVDNLEWVDAKENMRRFYSSTKCNKEFINKRNTANKLALTVKSLMDQKTVTKKGFMYNGRVYDTISDIYEENEPDFKNYRQCWGLLTKEGTIKKTKYLKFSFL